MKKEKIIIYGLGKAYHSLINLLRTEYEVVGVCDKNPNRIVEEYKFYNIDELLNITYDYIFITSQKYYEEIKAELINGYKIEPSKIISRQNALGGGIFKRRSQKFLGYKKAV